ncbi:hypothetical protein D915_010846 [Fasciola hepatica]|uniref:Uncharacterized protein n=1 Tax=Fasciola hepatica TaxID=6192 RepID=A0A4E0QVW4_FASHE|nr:hypothetical protein D915_010846 [Fasciola hepatica]
MDRMLLRSSVFEFSRNDTLCLARPHKDVSDPKVLRLPSKNFIDCIKYRVYFATFLVVLAVVRKLPQNTLRTKQHGDQAHFQVLVFIPIHKIRNDSKQRRGVIIQICLCTCVRVRN